MQQIDGGKLELPNLPSKIKGYKLFSEGEMSIEQNERIVISLDSKAAHPEVCAVVEAVIYRSDLEDITHDYRVLIRYQNRNLPIPERLQNLPERNFTPRERGFRLRYWRADDEDEKATLEFDMGKLVTFNQVQIMEKFNRIRAFELQYYEGGEWISFYKGSKMNYFSLKHEQIISRKVRLLLTKTEGGSPAIKMFDIY